MRAERDITGERGESIFSTRITEYHPVHGYLFRPTFLGGKWPGIDFIVELYEAGPVTPFFFVQIKATRRGYTVRDNRLRVSLSTGEVRSLAFRPVPTYVVGIDEAQETGYIVSANGENLASLSSLSTSFPINKNDHANRKRLWDEVKAFWGMPGLPKLTSAFIDPHWR